MPPPVCSAHRIILAGIAVAIQYKLRSSASHSQARVPFLGVCAIEFFQNSGRQAQPTRFASTHYHFFIPLEVVKVLLIGCAQRLNRRGFVDRVHGGRLLAHDNIGAKEDTVLIFQEELAYLC